MNSMTIVKMNPRDPDLARLREIAKASREGKIVGFPTETVYGMGAPMSQRGLSEKLGEIKNRRDVKPFSYHVGSWEMLEHLQINPTPAFRFLTRKFWPGPLTIVTVNRSGQQLGIRYPRNLLASALINSVGEPFIATSANLSGTPSPKSVREIPVTVQEQIDYLIDAGDCEFGKDSTIVDLTDEKDPKVVRAGVLAEEVKAAVEKVRAGKFPRRKILIVCTGNSCRSPMAEGWLKDELDRRGLSDEIEVSSCGVGTRDGMPATPEAVYVMKNREIDISEHRSQQCTREDILSADLILAMSQQHYMFITSMMPAAREKIKVLNVIDPIGMSMSVYEDVMNVIEKKMQSLWFDIVG